MTDTEGNPAARRVEVEEEDVHDGTVVEGEGVVVDSFNSTLFAITSGFDLSSNCLPVSS